MQTMRRLLYSALFLVSIILTGCTSGGSTTEPPVTTPQAIDEGCEATYKDTSTFSNYISGSWQSANNIQKLIIASDPQPFRYVDSTGKDQVGESQWNTAMGSITSLLKIERQGDKYVPLIINGDMTEFGHGNERKGFRSQIIKAPSGTAGPLFLPGLGNHDYENNINDCANNGCARDAVCDHIIWARTIQEKATGFSFDYTYNVNVHRGSLAYSFDIGMIHVVQLNNEPTYTTYFETGGHEIIGPKRKFDITSAMPWLAKDLASAKARGKYTIINMHKPSVWKDDSVRTGEFTDLVKNNKVIGIFYGHYHTALGKMRTTYGKVPTFHSGALMGKTYLRLLFDYQKREAQVDWYKNTDHVGEYKYNIDTLAAIRPEPGDPTALLTYYKGKNFTGPFCSVTLTPGAIKEINTECSGFGSQPGTSFKVKQFGDGVNTAQFCLSIPFFGGNRCYIGKYAGDFEVPDLTPLAKLPNGLFETRLGEDKGYETFTYQLFDATTNESAD